MISLTEQRGMKQVDILLKHPLVKHDKTLIKIFRIIEKDEPSHWAPYDGWLKAHGRREPKWWERAIDSFIHSELLFLKLPVLFFNPWLERRTDWADAHDPAERLGLADPGRGLTDDAMRILLTGSSGWLGRFLAPRLAAAGHEVIGLDVAPGADTDVVGSVADRALVDRIFGEHGIEAVIHAGALHKPDIARYPESAFRGGQCRGHAQPARGRGRGRATTASSSPRPPR